MKMTKQEIVDIINALKGPMVTTRARKDTLLEILRERQEDVKPEYSRNGTVRTFMLWSMIFALGVAWLQAI